MLLFRVQGLVEYVGEQEETGLNFKRPLLASSMGRGVGWGGNMRGGNQILYIFVIQRVACGPAPTL